MIKMKLIEAAAILGIHNAPRDIEFHGLSIDTRTLKPGNLYIALQGNRVDGHTFLDEAHAKGATCALVNHLIPSDLPQLCVKDTILGLGKLGAAWRNQFSIPFIAITGSNGKTTLKNMVAAILIAACGKDPDRVLFTQGTLNNHLGLPLTLAGLNQTHRYAVLEMGMNHFGEIDYLSSLTRPDVAVITNAAASHLDGVGNLAGVAKAKAEIFSSLNPNGVAILNRDDDFFPFWQGQIGKRKYLSFGLHDEAAVTIVDTAQPSTNPLRVKTPIGTVAIQLPLLGTHNVMNALAATAVGLALQIDLDAIKQGLESIQAAPGRMHLYNLPNGVKLIDDTYNANPFSLRAAVDTLSHFDGKKILVLGDMKELGSEAKLLHHLAGESIRAAGVDYLFTYGDLSANTAHAFGEGAYHFNEQTKLVDALKPLLCKQTTILVKGSRSMRMENVIKELLGLVETSLA